MLPFIVLKICFFIYSYSLLEYSILALIWYQICEYMSFSSSKMFLPRFILYIYVLRDNVIRRASQNLNPWLDLFRHPAYRNPRTTGFMSLPHTKQILIDSVISPHRIWPRFVEQARFLNALKLGFKYNLKIHMSLVK